MIFNKYRLEDITDKIGDGIHGTPEYDDNGDFYFVNGNNLVDGDIVFKNDTKRINEEQYLKNKRDLNKNTLLVSINGTLGNVAKYNNEKIILGKSACYINVKDDYNVDYVYFVFESPEFKKYLQYSANGTTIKNVPLSAIRNYEISIPSKENQDKIVKILKSIEDKIKLNNKINNNLYDIQKCYFKEIFSEQEYHEMRLDDIFIISAGGDAPKDKQDLPNDEYIYPIVSNGIENEGIYGYSKEYKIDKKSVTISARGTIGYKVLRDYNYYPIVRLISLFPKNDSISSEYLFYALDDIQILGTGTTQQQLTVPMVKDIRIKVYDVSLIKRFTDYSISLNKKIDNNKLENQKLSELRDTLLPRLMNGEIDLDNIEN